MRNADLARRLDLPFMAPLSESEIQKAVLAYLGKCAAKGVFYWHAASAPRNARTGRGAGAIKGLPDLMLVKDGFLFCLELKRERGAVEAHQRQIHESLRAAGAIVAVAKGLEQALQFLDDHKLIKGRLS